MYKSPIMGAGRGGGGERGNSRRSSHYFPEKIHVGAFYFFHEKGPFFMWGVFFSYGGVLGGFPSPPPTPVLQRIVLAPMPPPHGRTKKF